MIATIDFLKIGRDWWTCEKGELADDSALSSGQLIAQYHCAH
ncbi:MAG: hypothetical protein K0S79_1450 [Nitrospira sp.]|jgi:hypothetical protein|nr:hypothetical protein [Nitrospira sp.]